MASNCIGQWLQKKLADSLSLLLKAVPTLQKLAAQFSSDGSKN